MVYPDNVLHLATESSNKSHPATFPVALPTWFIKLLCPPDGLVLDPFVGSGTTLVAAMQVQRRATGIERSPQYVEIAQARVQAALLPVGGEEYV